MVTNTRRQNHIRQWRQKRKLSLRKLADRLESEPGGEPIVSYGSLSRIERGEQPWSEDIMHALSDALQVSIGALLEMDPDKEGEVVDLVRRLDDAKRAEAIQYIRYLASR